MAELHVPLHGWAAARWWAYAGVVTVVALLSNWRPDWAIPAVAFLIGAAVKFKWRRLPYGFLVSIPVGALLVAFTWRRASVTIIVAALLWAAVQTFEWQATYLIFDGQTIRYRFGAFWPREKLIGNRQLATMQMSEGPFGLYRLLGFVHLELDTAAQKDYLDRVRFARPHTYQLLTDPAAVAHALQNPDHFQSFTHRQ